LFAPKPWSNRTGVATADAAIGGPTSTGRAQSAKPNGHTAAVIAVDVSSRTCAG
jgi:hypothetical protein